MNNTKDKALERLERKLFEKFPELIKVLVSTNETIEDIVNEGHWEGDQFYFHDKEGEFALIFDGDFLEEGYYTEEMHGWNEWSKVWVEYDDMEQRVWHDYAGMIDCLSNNVDKISQI